MKPIATILFLCLLCNLFAQQVVRYDLYVKDTLVHFAGKPKRAIAVNGQLPMPTLVFTEGDTAEIHVHNLLKEETSLHWHGLFLPNKEDGVPYLTQMPIWPQAKHVYRFPIVQNGTHWYHSHSGLQEQIGMYGNFVLFKKADDPSFRKGIDDLPTVPIVLSEWSNIKPENIHRMLHNTNDYFAVKKNSVQSYAEAISAGRFKTKLKNEWKRMLAMDVSDVYYDKVLINGKPSIELGHVSGKVLKAGDQVRLRVSNGGASSYFWLRYAGGKITVVANDGNDVEPVEVDQLIIAVSETYDIVLKIPAENMAYEFMATTEGRTNSASIFIGNGKQQKLLPLPPIKYFEGMSMMKETSAHHGHHGGHENSTEKTVTLKYSMLKSPWNTTLPSHAPVKELRFELTGNMNRYVWSMDNKVVSEADKIRIKKGENVRVVLYNGSMMRHPMHLHGHDFRLLNGQGAFSPMKNIVDLMPMETDTLEFNANAVGDWFFHCHILYHMMSGMGRVFSYENQPPNPLISNPKLAQQKLFSDDRKFHFMAENDFATNGNDGMAMLQNTRWQVGSEWRLGYTDHHGYEVETHIGRYIGETQWLMPFIGFDWRFRKFGIDQAEKNLFGQTNSKDGRRQFTLGVNYLLPMLVIAQAEVFQDGNVRMQLSREDVALTKRLRMRFMVNTDKEYMAGFRYIAGKNTGFSVHYDSDMGVGFGFVLEY